MGKIILILFFSTVWIFLGYGTTWIVSDYFLDLIGQYQVKYNISSIKKNLIKDFPHIISSEYREFINDAYPKWFRILQICGILGGFITFIIAVAIFLITVIIWPIILLFKTILE